MSILSDKLWSKLRKARSADQVRETLYTHQIAFESERLVRPAEQIAGSASMSTVCRKCLTLAVLRPRCYACCCFEGHRPLANFAGERNGCTGSSI